MAFLKLDTGIVDSTLWGDTFAVKLFLTALNTAKPALYPDPVPQLALDSNATTGVAARLGHGVMMLMKVYAHSLPSMQQDAADRLAGLLHGGR